LGIAGQIDVRRHLRAQSIVEVFGGDVVRAGAVRRVALTRARGLLARMPQPFEAGRYHSLIASRRASVSRTRRRKAEIMGAVIASWWSRRAVPPERVDARG
jgi:anthranilate/para-aminobenzoate synthase component II